MLSEGISWNVDLFAVLNMSLHTSFTFAFCACKNPTRVLLSGASNRPVSTVRQLIYSVSLRIFISFKTPELLVCMCFASHSLSYPLRCMTLHCLLPLLHNDVVSLYRSVWPQSLYLGFQHRHGVCWKWEICFVQRPMSHSSTAVLDNYQEMF